MGMWYGWLPRGARQKPKPKAFRPMKVALNTNPRMEEHRKLMASCKSVGEGIGVATITSKERYDNPELASRDAKAREVKHTVAPICNKGGYQLISNEEDLKTVGRKI